MSAAPVGVEELSRKHNDADASFGRMYRKVMREIGPHVNDLEFRVLMFIFDRTYSYGKTSELIPMKHFLEGVKTGTGEILHPRLHSSRTSIYRALQRLIDNVIILRSNASNNSAGRYAINPVWEPQVSHQRDRGVPQMGQGSLTGGTPCLTQGTHNIETLTCDMNMDAPAPASASAEIDMSSAKDALMASVAAATTKSHEARGKRKAKLNATGLEKIWEDAFRAAYPDDTFFKWRVFEQSAFIRAVKRGVPVPLIEPFINFVVANFDNVINGYFAWMKNKPEVSVGFVTKHIAEFYKAFEDDRDPNRKIKRRIKDAAPAQPKAKVTDDGETERLRAEVASLKAKLGKKALTKKGHIKRLVRRRPTASAEFGAWEDGPGKRG